MTPKVLLISVNRESTPYPVFPVGVWMLANYLRIQGIHVDVADMYLLQDTATLENEYLADRTYDLVGLSIRNIDNLSWPDSVSYLPAIRACVDGVRQWVPPEKIVLGGSGYSIFGDLLLEHLGLTQGISGAGEQRFAALLGMKNPPPPDFHYAQAVPGDILQYYYRESGMLGLQTRRGCPLHCAYCTYPYIEGRQVQTRPPDGLLEEIAFLDERHAIDVFYFVDSLFNYPRAYTMELLRAIVADGRKFRWYAFVNPGYFDREMAELMKQAGCAGIEFGSESGCDATLRSLGKSYTADAVLAASNICRELDINYCHYLALGAPDETEATLVESIDLLKQCEGCTVIVSIGIRVYPHTPLAARLIHDGLMDANQPLLEPFFVQPRQIDLHGILDYCKRSCPLHWVYPGVEDSLDREKMRYLRERGLRGPLWDLL